MSQHRLVKLQRKNDQYFLDGQLLEWLKWPLAGLLTPGDAWAYYRGKELHSVYLAIHQCCTGLLVDFYQLDGMQACINHLPICVVDLAVDEATVGDGYCRLLATGEACSGKGTISLLENLAYGDWSWVNKIER